MTQAHFVIRTKMAEAFAKACNPRTSKGDPIKLDKPARKLVKHVLTNLSKGVGTKYDSSMRKKNKPADSAVRISQQEADAKAWMEREAA